MATWIQTAKRLFSGAFLLLLVALQMSFSAKAETFVTDVMLIGGSKTTVNNLKSTYTSQGWYVCDKDLNAGCGSSSDWIYLLYKTDSSPNINLGYITDFYITNASRPVSNTVSYGGRTYQLVPYEGDSHFKNMQGDLNSNAGGADIHLYYTKDPKDNKAVTGITFNSTKSGGLGLKGGSDPYDLNKGCGEETDYIYMHVSTASATIPTLSGGGTSSNPFIIKNANDWLAFAANVNHGTNTDKYYKLADNYSDQTDIKAMVGSDTYPFKGTLDGNGKTVNFNIFSYTSGSAPFCMVDGATIMNLEAHGSVMNDLAHHPAGLVGLCGSNNPVTIKNCKVWVNVFGTSYVGGIVGHGGHGTLTLEDCSYMGSLCNFRNYAGGLVGWCDALKLTIKNCFMGGYMNPSGGKCHPIALKNSGSTVTANVTGSYYLRNSFPYDGLGSNAIPGVTATPVSNEFVRGDWEDEVTIMGSKYYKLSTPKKLDYQIGFEYGTCDWTRLNMHANSGIVSDVRKSGQFSFNFVSANQDQYLISPELNALSSTVLKLSTKGTNYKVNIGYSRTTNDLNAFSWANDTEITVDRWADLSLDLPGGIKYIAIKFVAASSSFYVDDLSLTAPYPVPEDLRATELTDRSATFAWTRPSSDNLLGYFWKLKKASSEDDWIADNSIGNPDETSVTLTGLEPSTTYQFYIQSLYTGAQSSIFMIAEFTTDKAIAYLPYSYGFEDGMNGWETQDCASGTGIVNTFKYEGKCSFMFDTSSNDYQVLYSPVFEEGKSIAASFYCRTADASHPASMAVGTLGEGDEYINIIDTYQVRGSSWGKVDVKLPDGAKNFCIVWFKDNDATNKLYVDDFHFYETVNVDFAREGYATYFDSKHDIILPQGMKARVVTGVEDSGKVIYETIADGYAGTPEKSNAEEGVDDNAVPAGTPVLLQVDETAEPQTLYLMLDNPTSPYNDTNYLHGSDTQTSTVGGDFYYKLKYSQYGTDLGWYWEANGGTAFTSGAHQAWLALPASLAKSRLYMPLPMYDDPTGIQVLPQSDNEGIVIYNLAGQQILNGKSSNGKMPRGINIIKGKKILNK